MLSSEEPRAVHPDFTGSTRGFTKSCKNRRLRPKRVQPLQNTRMDLQHSFERPISVLNTGKNRDVYFQTQAATLHNPGMFTGLAKYPCNALPRREGALLELLRSSF